MKNFLSYTGMLIVFVGLLFIVMIVSRESKQSYQDRINTPEEVTCLTGDTIVFTGMATQVDHLENGVTAFTTEGNQRVETTLPCFVVKEKE